MNITIETDGTAGNTSVYLDGHRVDVGRLRVRIELDAGAIGDSRRIVIDPADFTRAAHVRAREMNNAAPPPELRCCGLYENEGPRCVLGNGHLAVESLHSAYFVRGCHVETLTWEEPEPC